MSVQRRKLQRGALRLSGHSRFAVQSGTNSTFAFTEFRVHDAVDELLNFHYYYSCFGRASTAAAAASATPSPTNTLHALGTG